MPGTLDSALASWKKADFRAHQGERELDAAWEEFYEGDGTAPPPALVRKVARLRRVADCRLRQCVSIQETTRFENRSSGRRIVWE
jgi:hypothetical protein